MILYYDPVNGVIALYYILGYLGLRTILLMNPTTLSIGIVPYSHRYLDTVYSYTWVILVLHSHVSSLAR